MKQRDQEEMQKLYKAWQASGESRARFAQHHGLRPSTFYYWVKKFEKSTGGFQALPVSDTVMSQTTSPWVVIHYPGGMTMELHTPVDASFLKALTD